jgi:urate oxidase
MSYAIVDDAYGKTNVKLLHIKREGALHSIQELEVNTHLTLASKKDYIDGDNSDIIATDSQKNTVYLLAKKHGVTCPETFALLLAQHFIQTYSHVLKARVYIEQYPWQRMTVDGKPHNHAFVFSPVATRFCTVHLGRNGKFRNIYFKDRAVIPFLFPGVPKIEAGIKDLRVLKTTQSAFVNFVSDEYRSLPDAPDRVMSTVVTSRWEYSSKDVDFCATW